MRYIFLLITAVLLFPTSGICSSVENNSSETESFFVGFEDMPLMSGLTQIIDAGVVFDAPQGKIAEAYAQGSSISEKELFAFYSHALTQLGWKKSKTAHSFAREGENLLIDVIEKKPLLLVRFKISPIL
ncbi:MAG: hypothetical protein KAJ75_05400 [Alphaproteobacteria bacterium]|nr:hypothetical protein [Alphaproteobacteria bacterium]